MFIKSWNRRLANLKESTNEADYPDAVMNKRVWTFQYLNDLYERSINGARSPKALQHLKKVYTQLYCSIITVSVVIVAIITTVLIIFLGK